jgi:hypothetical protein
MLADFSTFSGFMSGLAFDNVGLLWTGFTESREVQ